jgi:glycosyltransferase 2 family protein
VTYPAFGLALWVGVASVASSHLSRPYRYLGRWIIALGGFSALALGVATASGSIGAISLGLASAAAVHLIFGSPGGLPSLNQVRAALAGIGVSAEPLVVSRQSGVVHVSARGDHDESLDVKIYGRDAWDGQLLVSLWRFVWYRERGPRFALTRLQQVEHEAFLTLLAERRGALVNPVVAAGADSIGDALLVLKRSGHPLAEFGTTLSSSAAPAMWTCLAALHQAGISHGSIDADQIFVDGDSVRLADLSKSDVASPPSSFLLDRAQLLVTTAAAFGTDNAVSAALAALGTEGLAKVSSYVQPAALSSRLRRQVNEAGLDVDDVRAAAVLATGGEKRDLQRLRRLTIGRVFIGALLFFAMSKLITGLLEIGLDTIYESLKAANFYIVLLAFCVSMLGRPVNAFALTALAPVKVPLGRLTMLQLAMSFVNLAMPSTAGRVAVNIRFFQRSGVDPTTAVAIGAIDGFTGFLSQMFLIGSVLLFGLGTVELNLDQTFSLDAVRSLLILLGIAVVVAVAIVALVPALRRRVVEAFATLRQFLGPFLRSPRRVAKAMSANMLAELIGATTIFTVLGAFSQSVTFPDVILVSIGVSLFAGLMPVPGGIGVSEAALTAGFIAIGVPESTAFAAALTCRMVTYYTPPVLGWFAFRWMQRKHYL